MVRGTKLEVILPKELSTQREILTHQMKSLDFSDRQVEFIERIPQDITEKVSEIAKVIIS
ncbi:hypothetical protein [Xenorhabdus siamensis]|uniref:hypothetical protein n=1 Tax=Xenorhabdus siamensis TaxID=3136254 RepID=UPI0030F37CF1